MNGRYSAQIKKKIQQEEQRSKQQERKRLNGSTLSEKEER